MTEFLETTVDKFTFKVATDRYYSSEGFWAQDDGNRIRIGLTDFLQQRSGDVAFAEVKPVGTVAGRRRRSSHDRNDQGEHQPDIPRQRQGR